MIVEPDADLDLATSKVATHAFSYAGQTCVSIQRVYVRRECMDDFLAQLVPKVEALQVGDPAEETTDVGPVIDGANRERIKSWLQEALAAGAEIVTGGDEDGGLLSPTVLKGVTPEMKVCSQEIFGPVCSVIPYESIEEAFAQANSTEYGLQAAIFTRSIEPAVKAAAALEFGSVMINEAPEWRVDQMPYGGTKASGNTKEGPGLHRARDDRGAARRARRRLVRAAVLHAFEEPLVARSSSSTPRRRVSCRSAWQPAASVTPTSRGTGHPSIRASRRSRP